MWSWGVCVPNFGSELLFVWPGGVIILGRDTHKYMNTQTHIRVKIGISSIGCSPNMDFHFFRELRP